MAVWVTTDLHGNYDLWTQIKNFLKEDDTLIYLGDAVDRGGRGFEIFKELLEDSRVMFIRGNHEQMMYDAFTSTGPAATEFYKHWMQNGGQATLDNIKAMGLDYETKMELIRKIRDLPLVVKYENTMGIRFILCHAGYTPSPYFDNLYDDQKEHKLLWDRNHFSFPWDYDNPELDNVIVIHGHTPIPYQQQIMSVNKDGVVSTPYSYEHGHKLNLDAATPLSGWAFLYNLDTFDWEVFMAKPDFKEEYQKNYKGKK